MTKNRADAFRLRAGLPSKGPPLAGCAFVAINLIGITRSPVVWTDEVTLNSAARVLVTQGRFASGVFGTTLGFDKVYFWQPPGLALATSFVYRLFGFGIWQTRLFSLLAGGVCVWLGGKIAAHFAGTHAGNIASLLISVDPRFITTARGSRMDAPAIALLMFAFLLTIKRRPPAVSSAASGGLTAAAVLTHPLSVIWIAPLAVIHLRNGLRSVAVFAAGFGGVAALWLVWMLPKRELFAEQFIHHGATRSESGLLTRLPVNLGHFAHDFTRSPFVPVLTAAFFVVAAREWKRGSEIGRNALALSSAVGLSALMLLNWNAGWYEQYWLPTVYVGVAILIANRTNSALRALLLLTIVTGAIGAYGGRGVVLAGTWHERDYKVVDALVGRFVVAGDVVWGEPAIWYAVEERRATLDLRDSDSPSVHLPVSPNPHRHDLLIVRTPSHVDGACFTALGYRRVGSTSRPADETYRLEVWRRVDPPTRSQC